MKYRDCGFRPLYKNFCIFPLNDVIRNALKGEPGIDEAEGVMTYGYVDHVAGNTVEFIALTKREDDEKYSFIKLTDDARFFARVENLADEEFEFAAPGDSHLYEQFQLKIETLSLYYDVNENVAKSRDMAFLDEFRYEYSFDDVKVILYKEGLELEGVWAKIETLGKGVIVGTVMNAPEQDFGVTTGDQIAFVVNEDKNKEKSLIANLTPAKKYTPEELKGGKILEDALRAFAKDQSKYKLYAILEILRDSTVVVAKTKKNVDLLASGNKSFYPVYSDMIETFKCKEDAQKIEIPFIDALKQAKKDRKVTGIVVNPYSDAFVIPKSMFELIESMV